MCTCAALLFTPSSAPGQSPMAEEKGWVGGGSGDCTFIGMEVEIAVGRRWGGFWGVVRVIECVAWRRKKGGGAERRGEKPPPPSCLKNWRGKGGRRRRGADRQDRRFRGGGEGRTGGWLAPWLACVCGERGWAINSSCSSNSLRRFDVHNCLFAPGADPMS